MEITINSNAKLEIESSGDYKKDAKKACRFAYIKKDKKINKNFQRFIEASKKIKEAEAAGEK
ncbi:MAG: hypothetical protein FWH05_06515, partial [Oscillospiraceae bacterium]|nr:hypothetical protein [Oscillospiraceae bacterium]